ncbi:myosin-G heavy chain isoform X5 [Octopus bimaculoides]|uniref:myosin-G heavy chain isoform X5 n=1 Tax=Octopus bimaculoides TaxID=37653 RepID=UPI0022DEA164|nr:myosin-G heavy chain isoform X5 [Octopus bimaculoides]
MVLFNVVFLMILKLLHRREKDYEVEVQRLARNKISLQETVRKLKMELSRMNIEFNIDDIPTNDDDDTDSNSTSTASEGNGPILSDVEEESITPVSQPVKAVSETVPGKKRPLSYHIVPSSFILNQEFTAPKIAPSLPTSSVMPLTSTALSDYKPQSLSKSLHTTPKVIELEKTHQSDSVSNTSESKLDSIICDTNTASTGAKKKVWVIPRTLEVKTQISSPELQKIQWSGSPLINNKHAMKSKEEPRIITKKQAAIPVLAQSVRVQELATTATTYSSPNILASAHQLSNILTPVICTTGNATLVPAAVKPVVSTGTAGQTSTPLTLVPNMARNSVTQILQQTVVQRQSQKKQTILSSSNNTTTTTLVNNINNNNTNDSNNNSNNNNNSSSNSNNSSGSSSNNNNNINNNNNSINCINTTNVAVATVAQVTTVQASKTLKSVSQLGRSTNSVRSVVPMTPSIIKPGLQPTGIKVSGITKVATLTTPISQSKKTIEASNTLTGLVVSSTTSTAPSTNVISVAHPIVTQTLPVMSAVKQILATPATQILPGSPITVNPLLGQSITRTQILNNVTNVGSSVVTTMSNSPSSISSSHSVVPLTPMKSVSQIVSPMAMMSSAVHMSPGLNQATQLNVIPRVQYQLFPSNQVVGQTVTTKPLVMVTVPTTTAVQVSMAVTSTTT